MLVKNDSIFVGGNFLWSVKKNANENGGTRFILRDNQNRIQADVTVAEPNPHYFYCDVMLPEAERSYNSTYVGARNDTHETIFVSMLEDWNESSVIKPPGFDTEALKIFCKSNKIYLEKLSKKAYEAGYGNN